MDWNDNLNDPGEQKGKQPENWRFQATTNIKIDSNTKECRWWKGLLHFSSAEGMAEYSSDTATRFSGK